VDNLLGKPHNLMKKIVGFSRKVDAFSGAMLKIDAPVGGSVMHLRTFSSTMYPLKGKKKASTTLSARWPEGG